MSRMTTSSVVGLAFGLLAAAASTPVSAQQPIAIGTSTQGALTVSDLMWSDGARYKIYTFSGQAGQYVSITMSSADFDTYLILQDQSGNQLSYNDDGGGGTNSLIQWTLGYAGQYRIIAKAYARDRYGNFQLMLSGGQPMAIGQPQPMPMAQPIQAPQMLGTIGTNQQVTGNLLPSDGRWDGKPAQLWGFQCAAGQGFQMDILSSWDNYALVFDPAGNVVARNDDSQGLNARINYTCPVAGMYRLGVTTYSTSTPTGPYTLQVQSMAPLGMAPSGQAPVPQPIPMNQPQPQAQPGATLPQPAPQAMPITGSIPAPGQNGQISVGENRQGRLETGDAQMNDGTWADVWQFQGQAGQHIRIELRSEEFDTYAQLLDAGGTRLAEDDDSLGDMNSMIEFTLPATGMFQIVVNNFSQERRAGIYTISLMLR
jgi:hypothetical protein